MFTKNEKVVALEAGIVGNIVKDNGDGTFRVRDSTGAVHDIDEFDLVPFEDSDALYVDDEDDTLWEDLQPYRNMSQGYY